MSQLLTVQDLKIADSILKLYKVKLRFDPDLEGGGCWPKKRLIVIGLKTERTYFWSTVCHELGHILAYENGDYLQYHDYKKFEKLTKKQKKKVCWEAEKYVDKLGEKIFNNLELQDTSFKYYIVYNNEAAKKYLWKYFGLIK